LLLKVTPPRAPQHLVMRARLASTADGLRERKCIIVRAPAGFGKTSLLAQWRREQLAHGAITAWVQAQRQDTPQRLLRALVLAVRISAGRPHFGQCLLDPVQSGDSDGYTLWLTEMAHLALDTMLFVDEADRLPAESVGALAYLLRHAPPNLRLAVAARGDFDLDLDDLIGYGQFATLTRETLRFEFEETLDAVSRRFGDRVGPDDAARLHELTDGWPLGLQLMLSSDSGAAPAAWVGPMIDDDATRKQFVASLLGNLDSADVGFLTRVAILERLHGDVCRALTLSDDAAERLARLVADTPIFIAAEGTDWLRMHSLARDALRQRFLTLPMQEQVMLHARAADWLAASGLIEAAASHALHAGQHSRANELADRSLYEALMAQGQQKTVLEWLDHMPFAELDRHPSLMLAAAWSLALSQHHDKAGRLVARILAQPGVDEATRFESAMILSGGAVFADRPDRFAELHDPWAQAPQVTNPLLLKIHANRSAVRVLLEGEPALARLRLQEAPRGDPGLASGYLGLWSHFITGLTYLWEGQALLAEKALRPALATAEGQLGRQAPFVAMLAALLAAAAWESNRPREAIALLANRRQVLEQSGLPEAVLFGFGTLVRAAATDNESRALELLEEMYAVGVARRLPRLCVASLTEQTRLHSHRFRAATCDDLCARIDAVLAKPECPRGRLWQRSVEVLRQVALGHAAIAAGAWRDALVPLAHADSLARELRQGRLHIELLSLRALVLDRCGEKAVDLLREAADLARTYGLERVFDDAHPVLRDWAVQMLPIRAAADQSVAGPLAAPMHSLELGQETAGARASPGIALTPKEHEVLGLLARNLSNKEIGLAMQVSEVTVKWHVKNLFAKLDAGARRQVVQRARIHGLLEVESRR